MLLFDPSICKLGEDPRERNTHINKELSANSVCLGKYLMQSEFPIEFVFKKVINTIPMKSSSQRSAPMGKKVSNFCQTRYRCVKKVELSRSILVGRLINI